MNATESPRTRGRQHKRVYRQNSSDFRGIWTKSAQQNKWEKFNIYHINIILISERVCEYY